MLFNRHFIILICSILFIGVIVWWQRPDTTVLAMANGDDAVYQDTIIKNYWERLDYRQINLAEAMTTVTAKGEHGTLAAMFEENPFLSVQNYQIQSTAIPNTYVVIVSLGSAIDQRQELNFHMQIEEFNGRWMITGIDQI